MLPEWRGWATAAMAGELGTKAGDGGVGVGGRAIGVGFGHGGILEAWGTRSLSQLMARSQRP